MSNSEYSDAPLTPLSIDHLQKMSGWIKFIAILGIIGASLGALGTLILLFAGGFLAFLIAGGLITLVFIITIKLLKSGTAFGNSAAANGDLREFEKGVSLQASYWKLYGIISLIGIAMTLLVMIFAGAAALAGGGGAIIEMLQGM